MNINNCYINVLLYKSYLSKTKKIKRIYNNSFLKSIVSFKSGPVEIIVTGTLVCDSISSINALVRI